MMKSEDLTLHCIGCGAQLQSDAEDRRGYIPQSGFRKLERAVNEQADQPLIYCQRCFRIRHYNQLERVELSDAEFLRMLNQVGLADALVVNIVDLFDLEGTMLSGLNRFIGKNPLLLVANKLDLFPSSVNRQKLIHHVNRVAKDQGLLPQETLLLSATKRQGIDTLFETIERLRQGRDVYVVGVTNVGKSTIINRLLQSIGIKDDVITMSHFPGTTLDFIKIPFEGGGELIDTPGIMHRYQLTHLLSPKSLKEVLPTKAIKPKTYQLDSGQTLFVSGLVRFDYLKGERNSISVYASNRLMIHRTKLANADHFYQKHVGELLVPPYREEYDTPPTKVRRELMIKRPTDLVIAGFGWVTIKNPGLVAIHVPKGVSVFIRDRLDG